MRAILLTLLIGMVLAGVARAEPADRRPPRVNSEGQKPKVQRPLSNPCAQFGPGFARIEGSETCIQIGGSVGIGIGGNIGGGR